MINEAAVAAEIRAWETYRLINPSAGDERRSAMRQFIETLASRDDLSAEALAVAGLKYLKGMETDERPAMP
jgi:hypothetical protein